MLTSETTAALSCTVLRTALSSIFVSHFSHYIHETAQVEFRSSLCDVWRAATRRPALDNRSLQNSVCLNLFPALSQRSAVEVTFKVALPI